MMEKNKGLKALFMMILLAGFLPSISKASCRVNSPVTINVPSQTVSPTEKGTAGTVLYRFETGIPQIYYDCGTSVKTTWFSSFSRADMGKTGLPNVYSTAIPGIGIRVKWPSSRSANTWVPGSYSCQGDCVESADRLLVEIVQTGNTSNGILPGGPLVDVNINADYQPEKTYPMLKVNLGEITVNVGSCSIIADNNNIDLGEYSLIDIIKPGFTGKKTDYSITLNCPSYSSASIRFEGKNAWGQSMGVLETNGTAKNALVKLYTKSGSRYSELSLNNDINFGSVQGFSGSRTVKYGAEMTFVDGMRDKVTPGDVKATVVYTLTIN